MLIRYLLPGFLLLALAACVRHVPEDKNQNADETSTADKPIVCDADANPATADRADCWWMQDANPQHQRRAAVTGPASAETRWTLDIENCLFDSPKLNTYGHAYGSCVHDNLGRTYFCGTLSIAGRDGSDCSGILHAVTDCGVMAWSRKFRGDPAGTPVVLDNGEIIVAVVASLSEDNPDGEAIGGNDLKDQYRSSLLIFDDRGAAVETVNTTGIMVEEPVVMPDGLFLVSLTEFFDDDGDGISLDIRSHLAAIDRTGREHWRRELGDPPMPPAVSRQSMIYVAAYMTREITAINSAGEEQWTHTLQGYPRGRIAVGDNGVLYIHVSDGGEANLSNGLEAVNQDGSLRWFHAALIADAGIALGPDGMVLFVEECAAPQPENISDNVLHRPLSCYDSAGTLQWQYFNPDFPVVNEFVLDSAGSLFITTTCNSNSVIAVSPTGKERWQVPVEGRYLWDWKPSIGPDGSIFVLVPIGETRHRLYCIGPGTPAAN